MSITPQQMEEFLTNGYVVVDGLFDEAAIQQMVNHYMELREEGPKPGDTGGTADHPEDPNHRYPRMINMHNWDKDSSDWALAPALIRAVEALIRDKPVLNQTMLYSKPPGGRGQALHQDEQYITIDPLIGVWVALDASDKAVGCMVVAPGSHRRGLFNVEAANTAISFTDVQTALPADLSPVEVEMKPGDALFFDGKLVHGSYPNTTGDRWRRSFICHFTGEHSTRFDPTPGTHVSHLK